MYRSFIEARSGEQTSELETENVSAVSQVRQQPQQHTVQKGGPDVPPPVQPKPQVSWASLMIVAACVWFLFFGGLEALTRTSSTIQTGATRVAQTAGVGVTLPTADIKVPTATPRAIPTRSGNTDSNGGGVPALGVGGVTAAPATVTPGLAANAIVCDIITWQDGSQTCNNGTPIDAEHSQAGYCVVVSQDMCANGQPTGIIESIDVEMVDEPTNTPWPAKVTDEIVKSGTIWSGYYDAEGTSCVTVAFADGRVQTNCGPKGVRYPASNLEFIARMIIDGRLGPGGFPKG